jgi:hypothetical protein
MKIKIRQLRRLIKEAMMQSHTRSDRSGYEHQWAKDWGWTHVPWPKFVARFPKEAAVFVENYTEGWSEEEIQASGGADVLSWDALYDDEPYIDNKGRPVLQGNITGPGGSMFLGYVDGDAEEVLYDDNGNREGDDDYEDS